MAKIHVVDLEDEEFYAVTTENPVGRKSGVGRIAGRCGEEEEEEERLGVARKGLDGCNYRCSKMGAGGNSIERRPEKFSGCRREDRNKQSVVAGLDGTLLKDPSPFAYYMLVAFEAGGYPRAILLLLVAPIAWIVSRFFSEAVGTKFIIFVTFAGLQTKKIESVCRSVLPKFFCEDINPKTWGAFSCFGKRYLLTEMPKIMAEIFAKEYLGVDEIIATEIEMTKGGWATGFVKQDVCVPAGAGKTTALLNALGGDYLPDVGLGSNPRSDFLYMSLCKEKYFASDPDLQKFGPRKMPKAPMFHNGRWVRRPVPLVALCCFLWTPVGFMLALLRLVSSALPMRMGKVMLGLLGVKIVVKGNPPVRDPDEDGKKSSVLFVCNHRSLVDPVYISFALCRCIPALIFSISKVTELLSPIKLVGLCRDRKRDAQKIKSWMEVGDLCIFPEGTTCREPFLLRFSALFAEVTDQIVPVAISNQLGMFYGSAANGWNCMDVFFSLMNPQPVYEITFLSKLPMEQTCTGGKTCVEVANYVQSAIASTLKYQCTTITRKEKYNILAGRLDGADRIRKRSISYTFERQSSLKLKSYRIRGFKGLLLKTLSACPVRNFKSRSCSSTGDIMAPMTPFSVKHENCT